MTVYKDIEIGLKQAIDSTQYSSKEVRRQYRFVERMNYRAELLLYHNGELACVKHIWRDELDAEIDLLEEQGYTLGYTKDEVEAARHIYEKMLEGAIFKNKEDVSHA